MIRFGTSSWNYPDWKGSIYRKEYRSEKEFTRYSLREYAADSRFTTVGIDRFFYAPPNISLLREYADMVPDDFVWVSKVWERITIPRYPSHPRYGKLKGLENPQFLDPQVFEQQVLAPYRDPQVKPHTGPFVFQFGTVSKSLAVYDHFLERLERFLTALPAEFQYAVEIRNPEFLTDSYFALLNRSGVTHCFNHWHYMPPLKEQMQSAATAGGLEAPFYVARILTPLGVSYQQAVKKYQPYDSLKQPLEEMRKDVVRFVRRAIERQVPAFVIVNNRAEGNAPMTIDALQREIEADASCRD